MTPNQVLTRAKKRLRDSSSGLDWSGFYQDAIDEIFSLKEWRFARREINYVHPASTFEYQLNHDADEKALNKLISAYCTTSYALVGGIPIPSAGTAVPLAYYPYAAFLRDFPDHVTDGLPQYITEIVRNDGTNGGTIALYYRPNADAAVWLYGDFIPSYVVDDNPIPVLPRQFHRILIDKVVEMAAEEKGMEKMSAKAESRFNKGILQLDTWDSSQPIYRPQYQPYRGLSTNKFLRYPPNYPIEVSR